MQRRVYVLVAAGQLAMACEGEPATLDGGDATVDRPDAFVEPDATAPPTCEVGNGGCDPNAICAEAGTRIVCRCLPRYYGDGRTCERQLAVEVGARIKGVEPSLFDAFGHDVAVSAEGGWLVVGAPRESTGGFGPGFVNVYRREGAAWFHDASLGSSVAGARDRFGQVVAVSNDGTRVFSGSLGPQSVSVFRRLSDGWVEEAILSPPLGPAGYGISIAPNGDGSRLAIGAWEESTGGVDAVGVVHVFDRVGETWVRSYTVDSPNPSRRGQFGFSVALDGEGEVLAVGEPSEDSGSSGVDATLGFRNAEDSGAVHVYRDEGGEMLRITSIKARRLEAGASFGYAVALSADGRGLAVGAPREDSSLEAEFDGGAVYLYVVGTGGWEFEARLDAQQRQRGDEFGWDVALADDGDALVVGIPNERSSQRVGVTRPNPTGDGPGRAGGAYVYRRVDDRWRFDSFLKAPVPRWGAQFGWSVAISRDLQTIAVGAPRDDSGGAGVHMDPPLSPTPAGPSYSGTVFVFR